MSNPLNEWRGKQAPYWLREDDAEMRSHRIEHLARLGVLQAMHRGQHEASKAPNPLARSWHDL